MNFTANMDCKLDFILFLAVFVLGVGRAQDDNQAPLLVHGRKGTSARFYIVFSEGQNVIENEWRFGKTKPINKILELSCAEKVTKDYIKNMENRLTLHENTSLEISNLQPEDQGLYNGLVILQSNRQIYQLYNLQIHEQFPYPVIRWEGSSACLSLGIPHRVIDDVHWYKEEPKSGELKIASVVGGTTKNIFVKELMPQLEINTNDCDLKINSLQLNNSGIYRAESYLRNKNHEEIKFQLIVYESSTKNVTGREEESIQLRLASSNEPFDEIEWIFGKCSPEVTIALLEKNGSVSYNTEKNESRLNLNAADGTLEINKLQLTDSGAYKVMVKFNGTVKRQIFYLTVKENIFYVSGTEGQSIHFPINVKNQTFQKIEWTFGTRRPYQKIASFSPEYSRTNYTEQFSSRLKLDAEDSSLNITDLFIQDCGFYECFIMLSSGTSLRKMFHLEVTGNSVIIIKIEGESVRLSVGKIIGTLSEIDWRYGSTAPNEKIAGGRRGGIAVYYQNKNRTKKRWSLNITDGSFQIDDLKMEDSGVYDSIILTSSAIPLHKMFHLVVQGKTKYVEGPTVGEVVLSILLTVTCVIIGVLLFPSIRRKVTRCRMQQERVVRYSEASQQSPESTELNCIEMRELQEAM